MTKNLVQIIYLNGPSSSGKTTLAKQLQCVFEEPFLHIGIDKIIGWMPDKVNDWTGGKAPLGFSWKKGQDELGYPIQELQCGPYAQKIAETFREMVLVLAQMGHHMIIDDVSFGREQVEIWKSSLKDFQVLWVSVNAPLCVLEHREKERGNRMVGSARAQFHKVHKDVLYDLEIDTHHTSPEENAEKIKFLTKTICNHPKLHHHVSRIGIYGVAKEENKILLVIQEKGPYAGLFDLPGGKIEFGETVDQTLHREFLEETGMDFETMSQIDNFSICFEFSENEIYYMFHHIGLIYSVLNLRKADMFKSSMKYLWVDVRILSQEKVTPFVWELVKTNRL